MDRNLFKYKSVGWDARPGGGSGQHGQHSRQQAPAQLVSVRPAPIPHSWREALSGAAVAAPGVQQVAATVVRPQPIAAMVAPPQPVAAAAQPQLSVPQHKPVHVRRAAPAAPVAPAARQPAAQPGMDGVSRQPLQPALRPVPGPMQQRPQRPVAQSVSVASMAPGAMPSGAMPSGVMPELQQLQQPSLRQLPPQPHSAANPGQHHMQAALPSARSAAETASGELYDKVEAVKKAPMSGSRRSLRRRVARSAVWLGAAATAFGLSFGAAVLPAYLHNSKTAEQVTAAVASQEPSTAQSDSSALVAGNSQPALQATSGGQAGASFASSSDSGLDKYGYTSTQITHNGRTVTIERENLPQAYNGDPAAVKGYAEKLGAVTSVQTSNWGTVYLVSLQDGRQLAALASTRYLVAMTTPGIMDASDWRTVIESYQP